MTLRFGGVVSLNDVSLQMYRGEILAVIGPNGAGKTSLFNSLTGVYTPQEGTIMLAGRPGDAPVSVLGKQDPRRQPPRGGPHVPEHPAVPGADRARERQGRRRDPAEVRARSRRCSACPGSAARSARAPAALRAARARSAWPARANELAGSLAYGEQRRLEIARALGTDPGVLLLDEPAAGTNPAEKRELAELIQRINVERRHQRAADRARHEAGHVDRRTASSCSTSARRSPRARPEEIQRDPAVVAAYLGTSAEEAAEQADRPAGAAPDRHRAPCTCATRSPAMTASNAVTERARLMLEVDDIEVRYGAIRALKGISLRRRRGRDRRPARRQRRRQDHHPEDRLGHAAARRWARSRYDGERIDGIPAARADQPRHLPRARGPARLPADDRGGEPRDGRLPVQDAPTRTTSSGCSSCSRGCKERYKQHGGTLSGGEQQMLAIGRALMGKPRLLLLDEPSMGLAPLIVAQIFDIIREINDQGVTVLLVEQNAAQALALADRGYVLETGEIVLDGHRPGAARRRPGPGRLPGRGDRGIIARCRCGSRPQAGTTTCQVLQIAASHRRLR